MSDPARDPLDQAIDRVAARMVSAEGMNRPFDSPTGRASRRPAGLAQDRPFDSPTGLAQDRVMAEQIVARLPERSGSDGWWRVLLPQAAVAAALIVATLVWTTRNREPVVPNPVTVPSRADAGVATRDVPAVPAPAAGVDGLVKAAGVIVRRAPPAAAPLPADHERSLAPVEAPTPLEVVSLASPSLPEEAFVVLAPIVLTELPLSGESISPQK